VQAFSVTDVRCRFGVINWLKTSNCTSVISILEDCCALCHLCQSLSNTYKLSVSHY
jgi:hypothetical protein